MSGFNYGYDGYDEDEALAHALNASMQSTSTTRHNYERDDDLDAAIAASLAYDNDGVRAASAAYQDTLQDRMYMDPYTTASMAASAAEHERVIRETKLKNAIKKMENEKRAAFRQFIGEIAAFIQKLQKINPSDITKKHKQTGKPYAEIKQLIESELEENKKKISMYTQLIHNLEIWIEANATNNMNYDDADRMLNSFLMESDNDTYDNPDRFAYIEKYIQPVIVDDYEYGGRRNTKRKRSNKKRTRKGRRKNSRKYKK